MIYIYIYIYKILSWRTYIYIPIPILPIYICVCVRVSLDVIYTCILFTTINIPGEMFRVNGREREAEMVKRNVFSHFQQR